MTLHLSERTRLAGPVDVARYGEYTTPAEVTFTGRITDDAPFTVRPSRYHVYGGRFCPDSHRVAIIRELAGIQHLVTMSYVDDRRDGRGWAFRERHGPDPVNGFTLLREAYEATEEGYTGHVAVPTLWDRFGVRVVSNDATAIGIDLATRFRHLAIDPVDTYPAALRAKIEELARCTSLAELDARLADADYLVGGVLTDADIRLWVTLVRHDDLHTYPNLWRYARALLKIPAFRDTTDFGF
ncbi:glutathione S-transferase C-terminal domain-containing protein [Paractinoplanes durhamensis]|uniref:Glutathione-dependent reductase n=1 Tax=Paractinoplanes durhamensis TaxID=113563 RepID=A0ABQ3ZAF6_9ACTN|nr:glutathione S-transferase C-terminal domain-containing protein [Actinoplanes durhamensis]GIE06821.1 glutathione-dependent reductase [Actinoplanes durhamensis]